MAAAAAGLVVAALGAPDLPGPSPVPVADYVQYWAASRVNLAGGNPYDWHALLAAERTAEPALATPVMMWNPPWTLALTTLPSLLPYRESRSIWMLVNALILAGAAAFLWRYWGGPSKGTLAGAALAPLFPASLFALIMGQVSPVMLLGIAGFLYFEQRRQLGRAGAAAALTLVKPQVAYLLWVALLLWAVRGRRWRVLAGAAAAVAAMCVVPMLSNPRVLLQYLAAVSERPPSYFVTPTLSTLVRLLAGWEQTWPLVFVPLAGIAWLGWHWRGSAAAWTWQAAVSRVLLVSVVTSPYVWLFDQVVLLPAVLQVFAAHARDRTRRTALAACLCAAAVAAAFAMLRWGVFVSEAAPTSAGLRRQVLTTANMFWHVLIAPTLLAGLLALGRSLTHTLGDPPLAENPAVNRKACV